jgi:hypothetical protein
MTDADRFEILAVRYGTRAATKREIYFDYVWPSLER